MQIHRNTHNPILPLAHHIPDGEAHVFSDGCLSQTGDRRFFRRPRGHHGRLSEGFEGPATKFFGFRPVVSFSSRE